MVLLIVNDFTTGHATVDIFNTSMGFNYKEGTSIQRTIPKYNADAYTLLAQFVDAVVDDLHVMVVTTAGNEGENPADGLTVPGETFNGLVVGNMQEGQYLGFDKRYDDTVRPSSSRGPAAGRRKPDIMAVDHWPAGNTDWNANYGWGYLNLQKAFSQINYHSEIGLNPQSSS